MKVGDKTVLAVMGGDVLVSGWGWRGSYHFES